MSPSKLDLFNALKIEIAAGKGLNESVHLVNHDAERKRRKENKKRTTIIRMESYSPESYSEFHEQRDRYIRLAVDPSIGVMLMIRSMAAFSDATIQGWVKDGVQTEGDVAGPPPPKADLPDWLTD